MIVENKNRRSDAILFGSVLGKSDVVVPVCTDGER